MMNSTSSMPFGKKIWARTFYEAFILVPDKRTIFPLNILSRILADVVPVQHVKLPDLF
jgi:hypothetical protein